MSLGLTKFSEEEGIHAIIELQKFVGITETREKAKEGWNNMSTFDKSNTMAAYKALFGDKETII